MVEAEQALLRRWSGHAGRGEVIDLTADTLALSLDFNLKAAFSHDADDLQDDVGTQFLHRLTAPMREDTRSNLLFMKQTKRVRARIVSLMELRRQRIEPRFDLLAMFMDARYRDTAEPMSDQQIVARALPPGRGAGPGHEAGRGASVPAGSTRGIAGVRERARSGRSWAASTMNGCGHSQMRLCVANGADCMQRLASRSQRPFDASLPNPCARLVASARCGRCGARHRTSR